MPLITMGMDGIKMSVCFSTMLDRLSQEMPSIDRLSLDMLAELCGLHVNSLSRTVLLPACRSPVLTVTTETAARTALPDVIHSSRQSRSPPDHCVRSSFLIYFTLQQGSY